MIASLDSKGNPHVTDRRNCARQKVLFSSVVISESNCGRVLDISPNGLALQTDSELIGDEFPNFRFKFSPTLAWVEAGGRVVWRDKAINVVGIEFIRLADEVHKQIQTWIDSKRWLSEPSKNDVPVAEAGLNELWETETPVEESGNVTGAEAGTETRPVAPSPASEGVSLRAEHQHQPEITTANFVFPLDSVNLSTEHQHQPSINQTEAKGPRTAAEGVGDGNVVGGIGQRLKLVGLAFVLILLLSVLSVRRNYLQKSPKNIQTREAVHVPHPPSLSAQTPRPAETPPATSSKAILSTESPPVPTVPSSDRKAALRRPTFVLQVAAMVHEENANVLAASLREMNFPAFVLKLPTERFHHVLVGPYDSANAAIETQNELEKRGYKPIRTEWKVSSR